MRTNSFAYSNNFIKRVSFGNFAEPLRPITVESLSMLYPVVVNTAQDTFSSDEKDDVDKAFDNMDLNDRHSIIGTVLSGLFVRTFKDVDDTNQDRKRMGLELLAASIKVLPPKIRSSIIEIVNHHLYKMRGLADHGIPLAAPERIQAERLVGELILPRSLWMNFPGATVGVNRTSQIKSAFRDIFSMAFDCKNPVVVDVFKNLFRMILDSDCEERGYVLNMINKYKNKA